MKKRILILGLIALLGAPVLADYTMDEASSQEFLINNGYSQLMSDMIQKDKAQVNGVYYNLYPEKEYESTFLGQVWKGINCFFNYLDPIAERESFMNHNITSTPTYNDL
jgi:hypothetical protein